MSLRRMLSTAGVSVVLVSAGLLTAPAAQAAPAPGPAHWVSFGPHPTYERCKATGDHLVSIWLITEFTCAPYPPHTLSVWK
ncbi:hypothetical protein [Streptomyces sp. NPDC059076]|uniref:hypothetical protein n=1 Tax=unclassified Streptomyces TaxID=2593676 RepID=UPI0036C0C303